MGIALEVVHVLNIPFEDQTQREILLAYLSRLDVEAIEEGPTSLTLYHTDKSFLQGVVDRLSVYVSAIEQTISWSSIKNQNWNKAWESSFEPIIVEGFCTVLASFHTMAISTPHKVVIDPEMAFGTGHHETTFGMLSMMSRLSFVDKTVLDYGTGTGILAILAELLGASEILAIDNDPMAIECALKCGQTNQSAKVTFATQTIDQVSDLASFNIILANINRNVLLDTAALITAKAKTPCDLLLSGIKDVDADIILSTFSNLGWSLLTQTNDNDWLCLWLNKS